LNGSSLVFVFSGSYLIPYWYLFRNAHDLYFSPRPLTVVCNLLLQADCEGSSLISYAAFCGTLMSLTHTVFGL